MLDPVQDLRQIMVVWIDGLLSMPVGRARRLEIDTRKQSPSQHNLRQSAVYVYVGIPSSQLMSSSGSITEPWRLCWQILAVLPPL